MILSSLMHVDVQQQLCINGGMDKAFASIPTPRARVT
jgi:hypothetical protein